MEISIGLAFVNKVNKIRGICNRIDENKIYYIYNDADNPNIYYEDSCRQKDVLYEGASLAYFHIEVYAIIRSIKDSVDMFGNKQRRADVLGSSLRVLSLEYLDEQRKVFGLQTNRPDKLVIQMLNQDLEFIFPTISVKRERPNIELQHGSIVKAVYNDKEGLFKKGDEFKIIEIIKNETFNKLTILTLENIKTNAKINSYQKYFKLI